MASLRKTIAQILLFVLALLPQTALAESPPSDCFADSDCQDGLLCAVDRCVPEEEICSESLECADGSVCDLGYDTCPNECGDDCPERCQAPQGICRVLRQACTADADCPGDKLCSSANAWVCSEGDKLCEQSVPLGCARFVLFCGPGDSGYACAHGDVCNADNRCVVAGTAEITETIIVDREKTARLREKWEREIEDASESGCSVAVLGAAGGAPPLWMLAGLLAAARLRRRSRE